MSERLTWRPIDTAPKDGTRILLSEGAQVLVGAWSDWGGESKACWDCEGWDPAWFEPTYWMPLPDPPKADRPERI